MIARSGGRMDTPKNYLSIDGNKVMAPTAERQAELEAASGESEDAFDISTPEKAHESLRPGIIILAVHAGYRAVVGVLGLAALGPALATGGVGALLGLGLTAGFLLVPALISGGLAWGIYRHSRIASIAAIIWALVLCIAPIALLVGGLPLGALLPLLFNAAMLTTLAWATMANFAWHRFQRGDLADPDVFD